MPKLGKNLLTQALDALKPSHHSEEVWTELSVPLTPEEVGEKAREAARLMGEAHEELEAAKREFRDLKDRAAGKNAEAKKLLDQVRSGHIHAACQVKRTYDFKNGKVWDEYDGKRYHERAMKQGEYDKAMAPMFDDEPGAEDSEDGTLVASTDGVLTRVAKPVRVQPAREGMTPLDADLRDVMRSERNTRTKGDLLT